MLDAPTDTLLVNRLKTAGDYELIGGAAYLSKVVNAVPNAAHATYYAEIAARWRQEPIKTVIAVGPQPAVERAARVGPAAAVRVFVGAAG